MKRIKSLHLLLLVLIVSSIVGVFYAGWIMGEQNYKAKISEAILRDGATPLEIMDLCNQYQQSIGKSIVTQPLYWTAILKVSLLNNDAETTEYAVTKLTELVGK